MKWFYKPTDDEQTELPFRAELFNADQMERYGKTLAQSHILAKKNVPNILLSRLADNEKTLIKTARELSNLTTEKNRITPAAEWLLDNFYLIEEQIRISKLHLPKGYGKKLPQLGMSFAKGYPRVYAIALQNIAHGDGRWDPETLTRFVDAYQSVSTLTLGELWAIPIMLRLALIENLRRISVQTIINENDRNLADSWADKMAEVAESDPKNLILVVADMARSNPPMRGTFISELIRRLQERGAALALPLTWIEQQLAENGFIVEQLVQEENQEQAANQISVSNSIASLRRLDEMDWREFVETLSVVNQTLSNDPAGAYNDMDFATRDRYRHVVERLAYLSSRTEEDVSTMAIRLAEVATDPRQRHVGFYLIDKGLSKLEQALHVRKSNIPSLFYYLGSIGLITFGLMTAMLLNVDITGGWLFLFGIAAVLCTSQVAVALVNWGSMLFVKPHALPKMDFSEGIPSKLRTLVVVPAMLNNIESLVEGLEVRFLGNRDEHLHFALLTDFNDASQEHCDADAELLAKAKEQIDELNQRYPGNIFFLFHRPRLWNSGEQSWMGYERKRGKLSALNVLLRRGEKKPFSLIVGNTEILSNVKYVITLDTDTQLPRDSARELVGAMAHPLNQAHYDATLQRVTEGYGILQPRIAEALPNPAGPTFYAKICGGEPGVDPYTRSVSNVYQDLFGEGSFIGKGIYDVDLFEKVLGERFPENQILSHDLLEGCYLRSGLLTDVPLYEHSPGSYLADATRRARWIRGDWQLAGWIFPPDHLSALSRWKLFDNLRRSLVPIAFMVLLGLSWTLLPSIWLLIILAISAIRWQFTPWLIYLTALPHETWYSLKSIVRTIWRMTISRRHLLEWVPSDQASQQFRDTPLQWIKTLWMGPTTAIIVSLFLNPTLLLLSSPLLLLWFTSPLILWKISRPVVRVKPKLTVEQIKFLQEQARKIWLFFETFVTAEDNWLPPDNYQEMPVEKIAHRTSPTNIGLALLANLTAYDFGYIDIKQLEERTKNTFETLEKMERYHGHFYNWYDTQTLDPLSPRYVSTVDSGNLAGHLLTLRQGLLELGLESLAQQAFDLAQMDVDFLYDQASHLMAIGYNVDEQRRDRSYYDLLSSEARMSIFVGIAQGQLPQESWFSLGRRLTTIHGDPLLLSWSGSMFEYLMPSLVMPSYDETLLDQSCYTAVRRQIDYGKDRSVPWGISESGYNVVDAHSNYQYRAFGVPGLGFQRGLAEELVIAPYATMMALMIVPEAACANLQRLAAMGAEGKFGFYEAIDYTLSRVPRGQNHAFVYSFMAHHQGMSFLALSYLLNHQPMQKRFMADPLFQSALLLLQERIPKIKSHSQSPDSFIFSTVSSQPQAAIRAFSSPHTRTPALQLLSNGRYHVMITQAGSGYSRWKDIAVTRWREDAACDNWGLFSYLCDVDTGVFWSTTYQPTAGHPDHFKVIFSKGHAEFTRSHEEIEAHTEIVVSPEDDIELRRLRIYNRSPIVRTLEFTSYGEIVLAAQAADQNHPAFSNLFVETEILPQHHAILATRRPSSEHETPPWLLHQLTIHSDEPCAVSFETDRAKFIGRGQTPATPVAMGTSRRLSNTAGAVLDPIMAIRCRFTLSPDASITLDLITGVTHTREQSMALLEKYHDRRLNNRVFGMAWTHSQVLLHQLNITETEAHLFNRLAGSIIYMNPARRAKPYIIASNQRGQSSLWGYSISGDLPIVLLHITDVNNLDLVRQLIHAHAYWRLKGLPVDLVILNEESSSYRQTLQDQVMSMMSAGMTLNVTDSAGGIFIRMADQMPPEDRILLESVARIILSDTKGSLVEQLARVPAKPPLIPRLIPIRKPGLTESLPPLPQDLLFFNELGGFTSDGREYIMRLDKNKKTPAPWSNVLANPDFGTLVSESGQGYTWTENAHEFRLTPWNNDPVEDSAGELFYLRDEETGQFWSPTPLPCPGEGEYETRHGFGYSVFEHIEDGIYSELWIYVALDASIKFSVLKIRNDSSRQRRLSATGYVEWVLGDMRAKNAPQIITELTDSGALLARNHYNAEFGDRTAFFQATTTQLFPVKRSVTGDRTEFLGRHGSHQQPAALQRTRLSGSTGAGLDPCGAIQLSFDLAEGQTREIVFSLGIDPTLLQRFQDPFAVQNALTAVQNYWQRILGIIQVKTPDPAVNLLANGWLLYQTLSSRIWGRTGYYQSSGAFGFRDQLQDVMALAHADPQRFRSQLLLCASRQFSEGDVQHWWHPPSGRGLRSRCSDDYLWLPFVTCHYIETTGDIAVLDEVVEFLHGRPLNTDEESYYDLPISSDETGTLYQHGVRAILHGLQFGEHGLPLIGSGDWNDGMNLVGEHGKGESIWLGFFLYTILNRFVVLAEKQNDVAFAERCRQESKKLQQNLEKHGWDGEWYRRAYFDDGTPLGSATNEECKIDSIAQSWSLLSGAAKPERTKQAMSSLQKYLVQQDDALIKLLTPPFDHSALNPGYIKGYIPGVRENGGQYTHAAVWAIMAFAELGETELAWSLFSLINPINHGRTPDEIAHYKIEPYVTAGDVYSVAPHTGRGGWSWYTGSSAWMYRLITESLLGIRLENKQLSINPRLPEDWEEFSMDYRHGKTVYHITVKQSSGKIKLLLDGVELKGNNILCS